MNYYNEHDPKAAQWLRELIKEGEIPEGEVDERSITDVKSADLVRFTQCHFFAGIGGWPLALRLAGWPADRTVWTGSCPCPPFSAAGRKKACPQCGGRRPVPCPRRTGYFICIECEHAWFADERHLWPEFWRLIRDGNPPVIFGEQVANTDGRIWLAGVRASLERIGYAVGAADLAAASVGAPHIRQRLFWLGVANGAGRNARQLTGAPAGYRDTAIATMRVGVDLADTNDEGSQGRQCAQLRECSNEWPIGPSGNAGGMAETNDAERRSDLAGASWSSIEPRTGGEFNHWSDYELVPCRDGKARRAKPGVFPLAHGIPGRVGLLRGAGNAIVPQVAAEFIEAADEAMNSRQRELA